MMLEAELRKKEKKLLAFFLSPVAITCFQLLLVFFFYQCSYLFNNIHVLLVFASILIVWECILYHLDDRE